VSRAPLTDAFRAFPFQPNLCSADAVCDRAGLPAATPARNAPAMAVRFRTTSLLAGLALALLATAAAARDYVVVSSTDPAIARGQTFEAGARLAVGPGKAITLMHASGDLVRLRGVAGGVLLPKRVASQGDADRLAILKVIVAPAERSQSGGIKLARTRAGVCPPAENVTTLDAVVQVYQAGCAAVAAEALDAWFASHPPTSE
jgi:hypothetical protein